MRHAQRRKILLQVLGLLGRLIAESVEGAGDDLSLLLGELAGIVVATTATPPTLLLLVVLREGADVEEINVRCRRLRATHCVVVGGAGVIRHDVPRLELEVLEREGMRGGHLRRAARGDVERLRLLGAAVHGVDELHLLHAVIVLRLHLGVYLVDV